MKKAKPTTWRPNSTLKPPSKAIARTKPPSKVNRARMKKRTEAAFGDKASWIRTLPCAVPLPDYFDHVVTYMSGQMIEAAHIKSRGGGGKSEHLIPLCRLHHAEQHLFGVKTFAERYGLNLTELAAHYESLWALSPHNPENQGGVLSDLQQRL